MNAELELRDDLSPDEIIKYQERVIHGRLSGQMLDVFQGWIRRRVEKIEREAANCVSAASVPDSYFRAQFAAIRELRVWEQTLLRQKVESSKLSRMLDKLLNRKREVK